MHHIPNIDPIYAQFQLNVIDEPISINQLGQWACTKTDYMKKTMNKHQNNIKMIKLYIIYVDINKRFER